MTYDFNGAWDTVTGHNSPLYARASEMGTDREWLNLVSSFPTLFPVYIVGLAIIRWSTPKQRHTCRWDVKDIHISD